MPVFSPLTLPNGSHLSNRIAKASMEENMADAGQAPSEELITLYRAWGQGGSGLLLSGKVRVDARAMTGPGGVVLDAHSDLAPFRRWAEAGRSAGAQFWLQLNHPGRQMQANLGQPVVAPSAVALDMGSASRLFATPRELTESDIQALMQRFVISARRAQEAGFDGVQIHAAHGYLLSQFLSPLTNRRNDKRGGSLANRASLLLDIVSAVRQAVGPSFGVGVKINSADFQRGGFDVDDARWVVEQLNLLPVDLIELSGGSYEAPAMQGQARDGRTLQREAYFLEFVRDIATESRVPVMVTGGIRRQPVAEQVLDGGAQLVGMATALAIDPALPTRWQRGEEIAPSLRPVTWSNKVLASLANMAMVKFQLRRLSRGQPSNPQVAPSWALLREQLRTARLTRRYRRLMASRQSALDS